MSSTPNISIAMGTYNGEKHLREQLDSILKQTLLPYELVVTDDGSTDSTLEILEEFAQTAPFAVRIFRNEVNLKFADNFLKAGSLCTGDIVSFCDQDDIWLEIKLETCVAFFKDPEIMAVVHSAETFGSSAVPGYRYPYFSRTRILHGNRSEPFTSTTPGFAMLVRRELLNLINPEDRPARCYCHDQWTWFLATSAGKVVKSADVLARYRQHPSNLYGAPSRKDGGEDDTLLASVKQRISILDYTYMAEYENACADLLTDSLKRAPVRWKRAIEGSVKRLLIQSRIHRTRGALYGKTSNIYDRARLFLKMFFTGGYFLTGFTPGVKGSLKDFLVGVLRFHYDVNQAPRRAQS